MGDSAAALSRTHDMHHPPSLVGSRARPTSSGHQVFYSQNFALDLGLDYERPARDLVVVGQLLNRDWGPLADVPAYLISADCVVSRSMTGQLGEFHIEGPPGEAMHLQLVVNEEELIDVELSRNRQDDLHPVLLERDDVDELSGAPAPSAHGTERHDRRGPRDLISGRAEQQTATAGGRS